MVFLFFPTGLWLKKREMKKNEREREKKWDFKGGMSPREKRERQTRRGREGEFQKKGNPNKN